jgi:predicted acylesterase/phospholipase RssA
VTWKQIGSLLRTLFLLRVPVFTLVFLAALPFVALFLAKTLLRNLFDERVFRVTPGEGFFGITLLPTRTAWHLFSISFAAFLTAFTAVTVINLILYYGRDRFDDPALDLAQKRPLITFFLGILAAVPIVVAASYCSRAGQFDSDSPGPGTSGLWLMPVLGLLAALFLVLLAKIVQLFFTNPRTTHHPPPYLIFPVYKIPPLERLFDKLYCWQGKGVSGVKGFVNRISQWPLEILRCAGQGYLIDCNAPRGSLSLQSGHVFALALSVMAFATYLGIGYSKANINANPTSVPALAFVLLFIIVLCWVLGALTFFLDRYRVPLMSGLAILSLLTIFSTQSDHVYRVERAPTPERLDPAQLVRKRSNNGKQRIILVATAGGGIQAAAWTARVLRGLEEECAQSDSGSENQARCDFRNSVALISGVSGGSLGAIAYARSFTKNPTEVKATDVLTNAAHPALDEVAWGWMNPDVGRAVLPWFRTQFVDRGWALEQKWGAVNQTYIPPSSLLQFLSSDYRGDTFLRNWAEETNEGTMPGLLLNATLVEQGKPIVFSTTNFPHRNDPRGLINFYDRYQGFDLRVTTAARLSASFPYVAPAARADAEATTVGDQHIVDGGYYDNYGVTSLLGWLQDAMNDYQDLKDILILQIRPFGEEPYRPPKAKGWGYQIIAPVDALLDVRDTGQSARDATELALFAKAFKAKTNVWRADFFYPSDFTKDPQHRHCADAPLSWKLSAEQFQCITTAWENLRTEDSNPGNGRIGCVIGYLQNKTISGGPDSSGQKPICKAGDDPTS